jgi:putative membrane protein
MRPASIPHTFVTAAAVLALTAAGLSPAFAESGKKFIQQAIQGDNAEIAMGRLAAQKSGNQQVKDFGNTLLNDHTTAKNQATDVGRQLRVKPSDGMPRAARREEQKLQGMSGAAFDKEFVNYMIKDHQKAISEFQRQTKARDKATADLAKKQLPTLQKHLEMAQSLKSKM